MSETVVPEIVTLAPDQVPSRVAAAKELLRLERRVERAENALQLLRAHRERLLTLIGGGT